MPFVLTAVGILMIVTGAQGTYRQFASQVASDFTGKGNFAYWVAAIGAVGAVGYIQALQTVSRLFMALIIIGMFLSNKGFFAKLQSAIQSGPKAPQPGLSLGGGPVNSASGSTNSSGIIDDWLKNHLPSWLSAPLTSKVLPGSGTVSGTLLGQ